jgi:DNA polymerase elongation subunit (family B)
MFGLLSLKEIKNKMNKLPKILIFDVETSYLETKLKHWDSHVSDYITHDKMTVKEWAILAFAAKWLHQDKIIYSDNRKKKNKRDDKRLVKQLRELLDEADVIITKNGKRFDEKMFNARCAKHKIQPPSSYVHLDVETTVRKKFKLVSYSLEYLCEYFNTKHKKLKHGEFPGMTLWDECLAGNLKAWKEMEKYNKHDVLCTQDIFHIVKVWDKKIDFNVFVDIDNYICVCGSDKFRNKGVEYTETRRYTRYICKGCGKGVRGNLIKYPKKEIES